MSHRSAPHGGASPGGRRRTCEHSGVRLPDKSDGALGRGEVDGQADTRRNNGGCGGCRSDSAMVWQRYGVAA
ncbi:putative proline-rich protein 36 [Iris pallida]|uniref:Proline-rich protein 36 n=1 Tax=Iris pallida TaxID=29817 RepID=A0AAX6EBZ6_IRIPA|nr:putative proline-rich protein 36 [Iris pallida]